MRPGGRLACRMPAGRSSWPSTSRQPTWANVRVKPFAGGWEQSILDLFVLRVGGTYGGRRIWDHLIAGLDGSAVTTLDAADVL